MAKKTSKKKLHWRTLNTKPQIEFSHSMRLTSFHSKSTSLEQLLPSIFGQFLTHF